MMKKRLAVVGLAAALVLGSATAAVAAGGGNGPGPNSDCPGDCTGSRVQLQEQTRVENQADASDQVMNRAQEQQRLHLDEPAGDQQRLRLHEGDCDGTCDGARRR